MQDTARYTLGSPLPAGEKGVPRTGRKSSVPEAHEPLFMGSSYVSHDYPSPLRPLFRLASSARGMSLTTGVAALVFDPFGYSPELPLETEVKRARVSSAYHHELS
jgi:hypothetical protein